MIGPVLAIVAAWLALSLLTALWAESHPPAQGLRVALFGSLILWALIFIAVGGLGYGVHALWGAL